VTDVFTLFVELGRKPGDGLPARSTGAGLLCYAAGRDEAEAVRETVAVLQRAGMAPLAVEGLGTLAERRAGGEVIDEAEATLVAQAAAQDAVIVAQVTPVYPDEAPE
jgi:hypothetical protein